MGNLSTSNLVDERFELLSLVFRLAGNPEYNEIDTEYQRELNARFDAFKQHPAVAYKRQNLGFGYDTVFSMALHLEKAGDRFALINNTGYLFNDGMPTARWTPSNASPFIALLNDFYIDTDFVKFFDSHADLYTECSAAFERGVLRSFNFKWFEAYGANPDNMRIILSPATSRNCYAGTVYGVSSHNNIVCAALPGLKEYSKDYASFIAHEFAHSFANPIADALYEGNREFRKWCDDSVNLELLPFYPEGKHMAHEYVTRAYDTLYMIENFGANIEQDLNYHKKQGFAHIKDVYALVTKTA